MVGSHFLWGRRAFFWVADRRVEGVSATFDRDKTICTRFMSNLDLPATPLSSAQPVLDSNDNIDIK